jgi:hypothetical protein
MLMTMIDVVREDNESNESHASDPMNLGIQLLAWFCEALAFALDRALSTISFSW